MIPYNPTPRQNDQKIEIKAQWNVCHLPQDMVFVHCTNVSPEQIRKSSGLSPEFAKEYIVDTNHRPIGGGKLIFAMLEGSSKKSIHALLGDFKYTYEFVAKKGTECYCTNGCSQEQKITINKEIGFPYIIELKDFVAATLPN